MARIAGDDVVFPYIPAGRRRRVPNLRVTMLSIEVTERQAFAIRRERHSAMRRAVHTCVPNRLTSRQVDNRHEHRALTACTAFRRAERRFHIRAIHWIGLRHWP